jgi:hypothetical protein
VEPQRCEKDDDLVQVMQRLAAGDEAAVVTLYERYGSSIAAAVRHVARSRPGRLDDDDVGGAVLDVCFELARVAGGWSPAGGALPWVWARHRVAGAVDRALGQQAQSLDDQRTEVLDRLAVGAAPGPSTAEPSLLDTLDRLAAQDQPLGSGPGPTLADATMGSAVRNWTSQGSGSPGSASPGSGSPGSAVRSASPGSAVQELASRGSTVRSASSGSTVRSASSGSGSPRLAAHGSVVHGSGGHSLASLWSAAHRSAVVGPAAPGSASPGSAVHSTAEHGSAPYRSPSPERAMRDSPENGSLASRSAGGPRADDPRTRGAGGGATAVVDLTDPADAGLSETSVGVGLLAEALDRGGVSTRDRELLLEYAYEKHSGNGAPATAVAPLFDMREVSVRQAARRTRERLLRLAASEERFAPLADLPLLA